MTEIEINLHRWRSSLVSTLPVAGLLSKNPIVYKWKAPFRCILIREAAFWRITSLLEDAYSLHKNGRGLGSRIILRGAYETLALLLYLNHSIEAVLKGDTCFHDFSSKTVKLSVGSKNELGKIPAINVLTMLDKGDKKYPGLRKMYDTLSETAHPNFEGLIWGFSKVDHDEFETNFSDRWMGVYGERTLQAIELCLLTFEHEYDEVWVCVFNQFEDWIEEYDKELEASKPT